MNDKREQQDDIGGTPNQTENPIIYNEEDYTPKYSLGKWGVIVPSSAKPVKFNGPFPTKEEHRAFLRVAGCASDIFMASTPEELHSIADAELDEMTKSPPSKKGLELMTSWRDFHLDMICYLVKDTNHPRVHYLHRNATDDLERGEGMFHKRITMKEKIEENFKKAMYHNFPQAQLDKTFYDWSFEDLRGEFSLKPMQKSCINDDFKKSGAKIGRLTIGTWGQSLSYRTDDRPLDKYAAVVKTFNFTAPKIWEGLAVLLENPGGVVDMAKYDSDFPKRFHSLQEKEFKKIALEYTNKGGKEKGKFWRVKT